MLPGSPIEETRFTGEIKWVDLSVGKDDHSHLIDDADRIHMLMSKQ